MNISLAGKVAVVTGAASGIGLAIVRRFLECRIEGIIGVDRNPAPAELADYCAGSADRFAFVQGDVAEESTAVEYASAALNRFGRLDILVSNAGVSVVKPIHEHTPEEWDQVMNVNVKAMYWASRSVVPVMMQQRGGLILITGSISGICGIPTQGAYGPSKGALHEMTRQMAVEYASHNIRVNAIACGTVDTPIVDASAKASGDEQGYWNMLRRNHPIGRIATADEVAALFAYMASDYATFFTGSVVTLDGGYTAQ